MKNSKYLIDLQALKWQKQWQKKILENTLTKI